MAKVLFIINDLRMGGAQKVLTTIMNELVRLDYRVVLITNLPETTDFFTVNNIARYSTGLYGPSTNIVQAISRNLKRILKIRQVIREENPDCVFSFLTETNILTVLASVHTDTRVIISERSDPEKDRKAGIWELLRKLTYRRATLITSNSRATLKYFGNMVKSEKLVHLPNPIDGCDELEPARGTPETAITILFVGRLNYVKGLDLLIDAVAEIEPGSRTYKVLVAGDGPEKESLAQRTIEKNIDQYFEWLGKQNELTSIYRKASFLVLPSRREGVPNAMLEAMSCELPVIASDASPGPLEYVVNDQTGLVFKSESIGSLSSAIEKMMSDDGVRNRMGKNAKEKVRPFLVANVLPVWEQAIFQKSKQGGFIDR